jgi:2-polyprenyl-6-methoxyphenol hydroxylase-like FAD-dependent oxidoreductase
MVQQRAIVVGAGIGGLAAAGALRRAGWAVQVLEQAERLGPVGAGLTLWPTAVLALDALGVGPAVRELAHPLDRSGIRTAGGRWLSRTDTSRYPARLGAPLVAVHRADLHRLLLAVAGPELIRTGAQVTALDQDKDGVRVTWEGGEVSANLLVAADGLHSTLRRAWFGQASRPVFTGRMAWRAVLDHATGGGEAEEATESWGRGQRFGIVPLGRSRVYWFATADAPEHQRTPTGERAELLARFAGWHPPIPELIAATPPSAVLRHDLYELRPDLPIYARGRVVLLGDAAHAMTPDLGQGAGQALEDAVVLGAALATTGEVAAALARYDAERRPRTQAVARLSRRTGRLAQASGPLTSRLRDLAVRATPAGVNDRLLAPLLGWRPPTNAAQAIGIESVVVCDPSSQAGHVARPALGRPEPTLPVRTEGGTAHE